MPYDGPKETTFSLTSLVGRMTSIFGLYVARSLFWRQVFGVSFYEEQGWPGDVSWNSLASGGSLYHHSAGKFPGGRTGPLADSPGQGSLVALYPVWGGYMGLESVVTDPGPPEVIEELPVWGKLQKNPVTNVYSLLKSTDLGVTWVEIGTVTQYPPGPTQSGKLRSIIRMFDPSPFAEDDAGLSWIPGPYWNGMFLINDAYNGTYAAGNNYPIILGPRCNEGAYYAGGSAPRSAATVLPGSNVMFNGITFVGGESTPRSQMFLSTIGTTHYTKESTIWQGGLLDGSFHSGKKREIISAPTYIGNDITIAFLTWDTVSETINKLWVWNGISSTLIDIDNLKLFGSNLFFTNPIQVNLGNGTCVFLGSPTGSGTDNVLTYFDGASISTIPYVGDALLDPYPASRITGIEGPLGQGEFFIVKSYGETGDGRSATATKTGTVLNRNVIKIADEGLITGVTAITGFDFTSATISGASQNTITVSPELPAHWTTAEVTYTRVRRCHRIIIVYLYNSQMKTISWFPYDAQFPDFLFPTWAGGGLDTYLPDTNYVYTGNPDVPPVILTVSPLPPGQVGIAYSTTATADGGIIPYSWQIIGTIPGLTINASTGVISGVPLSVGIYSITLSVTSSTGKVGLKNVQITVV